MSEQNTPVEKASDPFAPLPDDENPALIDAQKTFAITIIGGIIFMGAVAVLIL